MEIWPFFDKSCLGWGEHGWGYAILSFFRCTVSMGIKISHMDPGEVTKLYHFLRLQKPWCHTRLGSKRCPDPWISMTLHLALTIFWGPLCLAWTPPFLDQNDIKKTDQGWFINHPKALNLRWFLTIPGRSLESPCTMCRQVTRGAWPFWSVCCPPILPLLGEMMRDGGSISSSENGGTPSHHP